MRRDRGRSSRRSLFDPGRPGRARRRLLAVALVVLVAAFATGWLDRSEVRRLELGTPGGVWVENRAGPVEVVERDGPVVVEASSSYFGAAPEVAHTADGDRAAVRVSCPGWGACRVALLVAVPPGTAVEAVSPDHPISVGPFTGELDVIGGAGGVSLGPVAGPLEVRTGAGPVRATDIRTGDVTIDTGAGSVELVIRTAPRAVTVTAGTGPVQLSVPDGRYQLHLQGDPVDDGGLEPAGAPAGSVTVVGAGPVTITTIPGEGPTPPDERVATDGAAATT